jgi:hypothetical protein
MAPPLCGQEHGLIDSFRVIRASPFSSTVLHVVDTLITEFVLPSRLEIGEELPEVAQTRFQRQPHEPVNLHA